MAELPTPLVLLLATAVESAAVVVLLPQYLPEHPLLWVFVRLIGLNIAAYAFYRITIWPRLLSPLRHLPGPSVSAIMTMLRSGELIDVLTGR